MLNKNKNNSSNSLVFGRRQKIRIQSSVVAFRCAYCATDISWVRRLANFQLLCTFYFRWRRSPPRVARWFLTLSSESCWLRSSSSWPKSKTSNLTDTPFPTQNKFYQVSFQNHFCYFCLKKILKVNFGLPNYLLRLWSSDDDSGIEH